MNIYTYVRTVFILLMLLLCGSTQAQSKKKVQKQVVVSPTEQLLAAYSDSLTAYKHKVDSLRQIADSLSNENECPSDNRYYRLFAPLNFHHDIAENQFSLRGDSSNAINRVLFTVYMKRPDLVKTTDTKLSAMNTENTEDEKAAELPQKTELTKQAAKNADTIVAEQPATDKALELYVAKPHFWTFKGDYFLQFMQTHVSENWHKGGSDSYSMLGTVTVQYNYNNKQKIKWENKLEMKLGFQTQESDTINRFKTTEDLLRYTSKFGVQAHKNWYYTAQLIANTQFAQGRKDNKKDVISDFMTPFNLNVSVGMDYTFTTKNNRFTATAHLAPLAFNFKYVDRKDLAKKFGIKTDHRTLEDFGSTYTVEFTWQPMDMLKWKGRLYGYTTYHKFETEFENTISFAFSRFISANVFLHPRFDDSVNRNSDAPFWQFKEYLSFGFSYSM